jgi:ABC-type molybdenum transport system ATPase subunit/photorepair protein PhrA
MATGPDWWKQILTFIFDWRILNPNLRVPESSLGEKHFSNILAVISALARNPGPAALLLDEPDSGLDALRSQLLGKLLTWLAARNHFVAVVSHHPAAYRDGVSIQAPLKEFAISDRRLVLRE